MEIFGRDVKFMRTVLANIEIANISPDKDPNRLIEALNADYASSQITSANFIIALNKGYEYHKKVNTPGYETNVLTLEEVLSLPDDLFVNLFTEALAAWSGDGKQTVESEPIKSKKKATAKKAEQ